MGRGGLGGNSRREVQTRILHKHIIIILSVVRHVILSAFNVHVADHHSYGYINVVEELVCTHAHFVCKYNYTHACACTSPSGWSQFPSECMKAEN